MSINPEKLIQEVTRELSDDYIRGYMTSLRDVRYRKMPDNFVENTPFWRIRLDLVFDSHVHLGLDIYEEIFLGRGKYETDFVGLLNEEEAAQLGVSRRHAVLRPTPTSLYLIDIGSTNGTKLNGHPIGLNIPYRLHDGDSIVFGQLEFIIRIIQTPKTPSASTPEDLMDVVPDIAVAITGCLEHDEVLDEAMQLVQAYTAADGASVWLVDEQTGELYQKVRRGENPEGGRNVPAKQVLKTGYLISNDPKQKTPSLPVMHAPIKLGGVTFGVLSTSRKSVDNQFTAQDQRLIEFIAEMTAVAIQNARMYQAKQTALAKHQRTIALMKDALNYTMKTMINNIVGNTGLLRDQLSPAEDGYVQAGYILDNGEQVLSYVEQLSDIVNLTQSKGIKQQYCDLVEITREACDALNSIAEQKSVKLDVELDGQPFLIAGNTSYLYRAVSGLIANGIFHTPENNAVGVCLTFYGTGLSLTITDFGAALPDDHTFDKYGGGLRGVRDEAHLTISLEFAHATARAHQGTLTAENLMDGGVAFTLNLPGHLRIAE